MTGAGIFIGRYYFNTHCERFEGKVNLGRVIPQGIPLIPHPSPALNLMLNVAKMQQCGTSDWTSNQWIDNQIICYKGWHWLRLTFTEVHSQWHSKITLMWNKQTLSKYTLFIALNPKVIHGQTKVKLAKHVGPTSTRQRKQCRQLASVKPTHQSHCSDVRYNSVTETSFWNTHCKMATDISVVSGIQVINL